MICRELYSDASNYKKGRRGYIQYIVIHYTGNKNDTALANAKYFTTPNRNASAHYFVDEQEIYKTVKNQDTAWHCGAAQYKHRYCRNYNSIGIELCTKYDAETGVYYFDEATLRNAALLTKQLIKAYHVPLANIIRHYDVTGKICPAPMVKAGYSPNKGFYAIGTELKTWDRFLSYLED